MTESSTTLQIDSMVGPSTPGSVSGDADFWSSIRDDFPILKERVHDRPLIYLDNAASSQKPRQVIDAIRDYYEHNHANVHRGVHELSNRATDAYESARNRVATFLNAASSSEIVFTRGTTESINLVAHAWGSEHLKPGDRILLTEMEHHSNLVPWQLVAARTGAELSFIPVSTSDGLLDLERVDALLDDNVKMLAMTQVSNSLGTINPVQDLCERARSRGILTLVDAAQSAGHMPVDVRALNCDFLAFSGHKICGPTGIGVLYGKAERLEEMAPYQGGGEMISFVDFHESTWNVIPHKFEAGTPNMAGAVGLHAAMDYLDSIGRQRIFEHDQDLATYAYQAMSALPGIRLFGPKTDRAGLVSFLFEGVHALDLVTMADQKGFALRAGHHCNQPLMKKLGVEGTARASFYFYNTREEMDALVDALGSIRKMLIS